MGKFNKKVVSVVYVINVVQKLVLSSYILGINIKNYEISMKLKD